MTRIVDVESQPVAVVRRPVPFAEIPAAQRQARALLREALGAAGVAALGRPLTVWWPPRDGVIDYAPGLFVPAGYAPSGEVSLLILPAGRAAHLRLPGPYDGLPAGWRQLFDDCAAQGWRPAGPNWEVYAAPDAPPDAVETDLYAALA